MTKMSKSVRIYEMGRGKSDNIALVDKLMLVVNTIDERANKVWFVVNSSIVEYRETPQSQTSRHEFTQDTHSYLLAPGETARIEMDGTVYQVALDSIGKDGECGEHRWTFCNFVVTW
jgi:hypothetical protein